MKDREKDSLDRRLAAVLPRTNKQARKRAKEIREAMPAIINIMPGSKPKKKRKKPSTQIHPV